MNDVFAKKCLDALKSYNREFTPKERFKKMVDAGTICEMGCVLLNGTFEHDPERHIMCIDEKDDHEERP